MLTKKDDCHRQLSCSVSLEIIHNYQRKFGWKNSEERTFQSAYSNNRIISRRLVEDKNYSSK